MKTAVIVHGCCTPEEFFDENNPSESNRHWIPWLQKRLVMKGIVTQTPEMPDPYEPAYKKWKAVFEQFRLDPESTLVGHSCGAGFLLRYLGETKTQLARLILVAPWLDLTGKRGEFLDFQLDQSIETRTNEMHILFSSNDTVEGVKESVDILSKTFARAKLRECKGAGHFTAGEIDTKEFPELLELMTS